MSVEKKRKKPNCDVFFFLLVMLSFNLLLIFLQELKTYFLRRNLMRFWDLECKRPSNAVKNFSCMHTEHLQYCLLIHLAKFTSYEATRILYLPSWPRRQTLKQANYYITISRPIKKCVTLWDQPATFLNQRCLLTLLAVGKSKERGGLSTSAFSCIPM